MMPAPVTVRYHFAPRCWLIPPDEFRLGFWLMWEGRPALVVWLVFAGFRIGWDIG